MDEFEIRELPAGAVEFDRRVQLVERGRAVGKLRAGDDDLPRERPVMSAHRTVHGHLAGYVFEIFPEQREAGIEQRRQLAETVDFRGDVERKILLPPRRRRAGNRRLAIEIHLVVRLLESQLVNLHAVVDERRAAGKRGPLAVPPLEIDRLVHPHRERRVRDVARRSLEREHPRLDRAAGFFGRIEKASQFGDGDLRKSAAHLEVEMPADTAPVLQLAVDVAAEGREVELHLRAAAGEAGEIGGERLHRESAVECKISDRELRLLHRRGAVDADECFFQPRLADLDPPDLNRPRPDAAGGDRQPACAQLPAVAPEREVRVEHFELRGEELVQPAVLGGGRLGDDRLRRHRPGSRLRRIETHLRIEAIDAELLEPLRATPQRKIFPGKNSIRPRDDDPGFRP